MIIVRRPRWGRCSELSRPSRWPGQGVRPEYSSTPDNQQTSTSCCSGGCVVFFVDTERSTRVTAVFFTREDRVLSSESYMNHTVAYLSQIAPQESQGLLRAHPAPALPRHVPFQCWLQRSSFVFGRLVIVIPLILSTLCCRQGFCHWGSCHGWPSHVFRLYFHKLLRSFLCLCLDTFRECSLICSDLCSLLLSKCLSRLQKKRLSFL